MTQATRRALSPGALAASELPLGEIRAQGWLLDQLRLQAEGITGQLHDIWADVGPNSGWLGGAGEDWERGPYYLDGLVPLAYVLDDPTLIAAAQPWIEWMLGSQDDTGFFGPPSNSDWWPRMVALKVLTQYADATGDERVAPMLSRYFAYQLKRLPDAPLASWGRVRGADNALSVWWLFRRTREQWLLELIDLIAGQTADWEHYLQHELITGRATVFSHYTHGPNVAMGLKAGAVSSLRDGDPAHRSATEASFDSLERWHGQVHGMFSGDEWLGGREATAGVETCQVVEMMFTLENLAAIYGGGVYGDRLESLAFNLLAAANDPRMLAHQYHQQANQVQASVARRPWTYSGDDANIFGLEPHFGCCTANLHQGWPKFVRSLWMATDDDGLMAVAYAPCTISTRIAGRRVQLDVVTSYPFEETISIAVGLDGPARFPIKLRVPEWCEHPAIRVAGELLGDAEPVDGYVTVDREWSDGDEVSLVLPMAPRVIARDRQAVGVRLGPLQMALKIRENWVPVGGAPGLAEWELHAARSWNIGLIEPASTAGSWIVTRTGVGPVPFELEAAPVTIVVEGAPLRTWRLDGAQAGLPPESPVVWATTVERFTLVPYGSARLRITEFPMALRPHEEE